MANDEKLLRDADRQIADYKKHVAEQEAKIAELSTKRQPPVACPTGRYQDLS